MSVAEGFYSIEPLGPRSKQLVYACLSTDGEHVHLWNAKGETVEDTTIATWHRIKPQFIHVHGGWTEARIKFRHPTGATRCT